MKQICTVCAEEIDSEAIFCSWCGEWQTPTGWHMKAGNPRRSHSPLRDIAAGFTSNSEFKSATLDGLTSAEWLLIEGDVALIGSKSRLAAWSISSIWNASPQSPLWNRSGACEWAAILRPYVCVGREQRVELVEITTGAALPDVIDCSWDVPDPLAIERYSRDLGRFALLILPATFGLTILKLSEDLNGVAKQEVHLPRDAGPVVGLQMDDKERVWVCTRSGFLACAPLTDFWGAEVDPHWERLPLDHAADARTVCFSVTGEGACVTGQLPSGNCFVQIASVGSVMSPQEVFNAVPQWPLVVDPDRPAVILADRRRGHWCVVDWGKQNVQMVHWTDQEFNAPDLSQCVTVPKTGPLVLLNSAPAEQALGQYARLEVDVDARHLKARGIRNIPISRRETIAAASGSLVMNVDGDTAYMIRGGAQTSGKVGS